VQPWRKLSPAERDAVVAEAESLPLPGLKGKRISVRWDEVLGCLSSALAGGPAATQAFAKFFFLKIDFS